MTQSVLRSMLTHRCTIIQATRPASGAGSYGHQTIDWTAPTNTYTNIRCRWRPMTNEELEQVNRSGTITADSFIYIMWTDMPATLKVFGAPIYHRVTSIKTASGVEIASSGYYDIQNVMDQAGESHHARLSLKRFG